MIEGLQEQGEPTQNGKVFYHPVVLTVSGVSQYKDTNISFSELDIMHTVIVVDPLTGVKREVENYAYWSLPQNFVFTNGRRAQGTNPSDGKLHVGDIAVFSLNLNPKRGSNAKPGSYYYNIGSVSPSNGKTPIERVQSQGQSAPQSGGSWASDTGSSDSEPYVDKWELRDIQIRKSQAENILALVLTSGDTVNAPKIVEKMGFKDVDEAIDAVANGWNLLRRGLPIEFPVAVSDMEEEEGVPDFADDNLDEDVETVSWD